MNIGIDIRPLMTKNKTGVGEYIFELLNAIFKLDKQNHYYLFHNAAKNHGLKNIDWNAWNTENVHYIQTGYPNKLFNLGLILKIRKIEQFLPVKIDLWYAPNLNFLSIGNTTPFLLTIHDLSFKLFPEFYTLKQSIWHKIINPKQQCHDAGIIITPSENTKRDLTNYYNIPKEKIKVLYPGVSDQFSLSNPELAVAKTRILHRYNLPENFILFLGSIEPRKNITAIIRAYEKLPPEITDKYHLLLVGAAGWKNKKIYQAASSSPLRERIKFIGYIPSEDRPAFYALSSLFIFNSFYEGFGFPVIEAMRMGVPTISSDRSSLPEIALDASYFINPNKISDLSKAIKIFLTDLDLRNLYIKKGHIVAQNYSCENTARRWLDIVEKLSKKT